MSLAMRAMAQHDLDDVMLLAAGCEGAPHWSRAVYQEIVTPPGAVLRHAFIAHDEQALAGFAVTGWLAVDTHAEVETVVVASQYRRQGVASGLLQACMLAASQDGARSIRLEVRTSNTAARALYQQNGFTAIGTRRAYYSNPVEDAVLLQAPLGFPHLPGPL